MEPVSIWIGADPREDAAYAVAHESVRSHLGGSPVQVRGLVLSALQRQGLYTRPTERRLGRLYDVISQHEMATEFAISRFLVPHLAKTGWALFMDCDMMVRSNLMTMFDSLDPKYALYCVKHDYTPIGDMKMDGQVQSNYPRKNWSSFMVFNCDHPAHKNLLTLEAVNNLPGRDLHRFGWLDDCEIGELAPGWNWLVGEQPEPSPLHNVHYTDGGPWLDAFQDVPYADEWRVWRERWTRAA